MKVPPKRKGNAKTGEVKDVYTPLNESPSEKEGKSKNLRVVVFASANPSMKVPPKRKGNIVANVSGSRPVPLNESPSEKEGKYRLVRFRVLNLVALNESPSEKEGK